MFAFRTVVGTPDIVFQQFLAAEQCIGLMLSKVLQIEILYMINQGTIKIKSLDLIRDSKILFIMTKDS